MNMTQAKTNPLSDWTGRTEERHDRVCAAPLARLAATLGRPELVWAPGTELPPLWHWLFFTPQPHSGDTGPDGHARRGGFLPPVALPRRMWAGGQLQFNHALQVGAEIQRRSRIAQVRSKSGRSGELVFVRVEHEISDARGVALTEAHDIVYRDAPQPGGEAPPPQAAPEQAEFSREINPDPVLLFRYSALTFNSHRIHYDRSYTTGVEGYPGLLVHGPLIATLLIELLRDTLAQVRVTRFEFKALSPLFDIHRFHVHGRHEAAKRYALWASDHRGGLAMQAWAEVE